MKRILAAVLLMVLVFSLCGCNRSTVVSSSFEFGSDDGYAIDRKPPSEQPVEKPSTEFFDTTNQSYLNDTSDPTTLSYVEPTLPERVINVKDFGAVGDGVADDREAIYKALEEAVKNLPATVYFPQGEYAIYTAGMYVYLPLGTDGLAIKGDGGDKSIIKFAEDWKTKGSWVALRIMPETTPANQDGYLKNIIISDIGVYDTNPIGHASSSEETHGLDIQYCIGATIKNCKINNVGDEAIDMVYCINSNIANNTVVNSPGAGKAGGAISVGDGCENVLIINNTVDGTIKEKSNFGIAIEALNFPVKNVQIKNNTIKNISGNAINIGAPNGAISDIIIYNNVISDSTNGLQFSGKGTKSNVQIKKTNISNVKTGFVIDGAAIQNMSIDNFEINGATSRGISIKTGKDLLVKNGVLTNLGGDAIWNAANNTNVQNIKIDGVGLSKNTVPAISQYAKSGSCSLENVTVKNCKNKVAIKDVHTLNNVSVDQAQTAGFYCVQGASKITGGYFSRHITNFKSGAIVDGAIVKISQNVGSTPAIYLTVWGCTVKNCTVEVASGKTIVESQNANSNTVCNNACYGGRIEKNGDQSSFYDNIAR